MPIRFPRPMRHGDVVAITSPSSGITGDMQARLDVAIDVVRARGFEVVVGDCMDGARHVSAPAAERARELTRFLTDPRIRAVVPPWGGDTAIDLLPLLNWDAIASADPTWFVGFSDISTLLTPLTLRTGVATLHGNNLLDTPYRVPEGLVGWLDVVTMESASSFTQTSPERYRSARHDSYRTNPTISTMTLDASGTWTRFDGGTDAIDIVGRLIGGCIDTLCNIAGTPFGDVTAFARDYAHEGLLIYIEASDDDALSICRYLHGMRLAGFFDRANAILVGRTSAPDSATMTQREAVLDALGSLGVPIIGDVECGHVQPFMPIVNGARGRVQFDGVHGSVTQTLA